MKKEYSAPKLEIKIIEIKDIMCASGELSPGGNPGNQQGEIEV